MSTKGKPTEIRNRLEQSFSRNEDTQTYLTAIQEIYINDLINRGQEQATVKLTYQMGVKFVADFGYAEWKRTAFPTLPKETADLFDRIMYLQEAIDTYEELYQFLLYFRNELA